ncbi:MAG TPA: LamG domain-containing protein [Phycisphaerales bacterium]|nr:LamG domain-containing protein [Phycisphaerales bacterium]
MSKRLTCLIAFVLLVSIGSGASADLLVHWRLDEGSGTIAADSSGNGYDGTFNGDPQWVAGHDSAGALHFDGVDDYVSHSLPGDQTYAAFTIAVWAKADDVAQDDLAGVFTSHFPGGATGAGFQIDLSAGSMVYQIRPNSGGGVFGDATTDWVHLAVVGEGTSVQLYYQGAPVATATLASDLFNAFAVGVNRNSSRWFAGTIDDLRVYDHALTEAEILGTMKGKPFPFALSPTPADGALHEATWVSLSWIPGSFAVSHDMYFGTSFDDVNNGAEGTFVGNLGVTSQVVGFPGFPAPEGLEPGTTYYWRIDEVNDADPNSPWKGNVWSFSIPPKTAYNPDPADGAGHVDPNATFTWTGGYGSKLHTVYLGDNYDDVNNATGGMPLGTPSYDPGTLEREKVLYWRVDEFDGAETHKGDVWSFTTPGAVGNPQPANGAADVQMIETLGWTAADNAASHELYFGTDAEAVNNATTASPEYIGPRALGAESYDPGGLAWDSSYAWRVDEVYPTGTVKGLVWTFDTADFILVDDFESYDDIDPAPGEPGINRIFDKWIDGFGTTTNGALVGNDLPPYAEQNIVHGGAQSMIYRYDNNLKTSEATLTLVWPRDWTAEGVTKLSLWFRGGSLNAADRMFVALNGTSVVYHDDASATQTTGWNQYVIDLQAFTGVNLTNVNTITIGIGTKDSPAAGGTGTMYFDDIALIR